MKKTNKFLISLLTLTLLFAGQMGVSAASSINTRRLYNGQLRAYVYIVPGFWESSARYSGTYGVSYIEVETNVPGSGYWTQRGSKSYAEDEGRRGRVNGTFARAYAYNGGPYALAGVATAII